jgi:hypothetical protein
MKVCILLISTSFDSCASQDGRCALELGPSPLSAQYTNLGSNCGKLGQDEQGITAQEA